MTDALTVSSLAAQTGRGAFLLEYVGRYGVTDALRLAPPEVIRGMTNESILVQTQEMLSQNTGYNVTPNKWLSIYQTIGPRGTYITNKSAIRNIIGEFEGSKVLQISQADANALEIALGLKSGTLVDGFKILKIVGIKDMNLSYPLDGNEYFLGPGKGLPGGGPELKIFPSLPTDSPFIVEQITVEVTP